MIKLSAAGSGGLKDSRFCVGFCRWCHEQTVNLSRRKPVICIGEVVGRFLHVTQILGFSN